MSEPLVIGNRWTLQRKFDPLYDVGLRWVTVRTCKTMANWVYSYQIEFKTDDASGDGTWWFKDQEGDEYRCRVVDTTISHVINFNSRKPAIVQVRKEDYKRILV